MNSKRMFKVAKMALNADSEKPSFRQGPTDCEDIYASNLSIYKNKSLYFSLSKDTLSDSSLFGANNLDHAGLVSYWLSHAENATSSRYAKIIITPVCTHQTM